MKHSRHYVFDFCGTLISAQTHSILKYYFLKNLKISYFFKYLFPKSSWLFYDVNFLRQLGDLSKIADFIIKNSSITLSLEFIRKELQNVEIIILTIADQSLVEKIVEKLGLVNCKVIGSNPWKLIDGELKATYLKKCKGNVIYFTDSVKDIPCFSHAEVVVFSEYAEPELLLLLDERHLLISEYEIRFKASSR